jgi:hypothetical protein
MTSRMEWDKSNKQTLMRKHGSETTTATKDPLPDYAERRFKRFTKRERELQRLAAEAVAAREKSG